MKKTVVYEWSFETLDDEGEISDINIEEKLSALNMSEAGELALVRDEGNSGEGLTSRLWAYVKDGKLPDYFSDGDKLTGYKVPLKYRVELAKFWLK